MPQTSLTPLSRGHHNTTKGRTIWLVGVALATPQKIMDHAQFFFSIVVFLFSLILKSKEAKCPITPIECLYEIYGSNQMQQLSKHITICYKLQTPTY